MTFIEAVEIAPFVLPLLALVSLHPSVNAPARELRIPSDLHEGSRDRAMCQLEFEGGWTLLALDA